MPHHVNRWKLVLELIPAPGRPPALQAANAEEEDEREHWGANQLVSLADKDVPVFPFK